MTEIESDGCVQFLRRVHANSSKEQFGPTRWTEHAEIWRPVWEDGRESVGIGVEVVCHHDNARPIVPIERGKGLVHVPDPYFVG
jgi:hypothetical protein